MSKLADIIEVYLDNAAHEDIIKIDKECSSVNHSYIKIIVKKDDLDSASTDTQLFK